MPNFAISRSSSRPSNESSSPLLVPKQVHVGFVAGDLPRREGLCRRIIICSAQDAFGRIASPHDLEGSDLKELDPKEGVGMATTDVARQNTGGQVERKRIVNDMSIQVATVNGSGSQSSNTVLLRAIF